MWSHRHRSTNFGHENILVCIQGTAFESFLRREVRLCENLRRLLSVQASMQCVLLRTQDEQNKTSGGASSSPSRSGASPTGAVGASTFYDVNLPNERLRYPSEERSEVPFVKAQYIWIGDAQRALSDLPIAQWTLLKEMLRMSAALLCDIGRFLGRIVL